MNLQLADGTVRCSAHMDASSYDRETDRPCLYCQEAAATDLPMAVRRDAGLAHLGDAVRARLACNDLRALSVAITRSFCEFCGEAPRPVGDALCESCGL